MSLFFPTSLESITLPDAKLLYAQEFFSLEQADQFLSTLIQEIPWQQENICIAGQLRLQPRLTAWHGDSDAHYSYSGLQLYPRAWTSTLLQIKRAIESAISSHYGCEFNSVLANLYRHHQDSMGWHSDDERELGHTPIIASVSLGVTRRFLLKHKTQRNLKFSIPLQHGSLLVMAGTTQTHWLHSIPKESSVMAPRINLTFRQILR